MMSLNESLLEYDKVGRESGIRQAIRSAGIYADDIRNRGNQGVVAQLNEQYYQILRQYTMALNADKTSYASVDWDTFRINPYIRYSWINGYTGMAKLICQLQ